MRLIDADALDKTISEEFHGVSATGFIYFMRDKTPIEVYNKVRDLIDNTPTVAPDMAQVLAYESGKASAERPKGEWIKGREISRTMLGNNVEDIVYKDYTCSNCGLVLDRLLYNHDGSPFYKFCPNCGAAMRDKE